MAYDGNAIPVIGKCIVKLARKGKPSIPAQMFVVPTDSSPIIGLETCQRLNLIKRVEILNCDDANFMPSQDVFGEIGCLSGEHHIQIEENATPVVHPPRRVPYALMNKLKTELDRMKRLDIIEEIDEPTEWVSSLVIIEKADGRLRVCLDPSDLNRVIKKEHYPMPTAETVMSEMSEAKYFSKLDASNGYWQIKVDEQSSKLLTFNTPFGRHRFKRLPFGILSASKVFQKKIAEIIQGLDGCTNVQDDILVWGSTKEQHDARLKAVMERIQQAGLKLNEKKCVFCSTEVVFLGHLFSHEGVKPDPTKIEAIRDMPTPKSKQDLQRLLGMITYLGKFIPNLSITTAPLRQLMESDVEWHWSNHHNAALDQIKKLLTESPTLKYYDSELPTRISVDASKFGLGAVLLQQHGDTWAPVAYASRSLNKSEQNYAQIEKEALAILFGCERFHVYLYGKCFTVESDHKPLQPIFKKPICKAPPRIQRFRLRLQKYDMHIEFKPEKELMVADTLSRAFIPTKKQDKETEAEFQVHLIMSSLPMSEIQRKRFRQETSNDEALQRPQAVVQAGWPNKKSDFTEDIRPYFSIRDEITEMNGILMKGERVIVPSSLRKEMKARIHEGHLGIEKCKARARETMFWPGINGEITEMVQQCSACLATRVYQQKEPLASHEVPAKPWQKVGADLFHFKDNDYLIVVDYFSNYPEMALLKGTTSSMVITHMKSIFARHGIPEIVISDNGPQFASKEFAEFAAKWEFSHITSSPRYPKANGMAERTVQTTKKLLEKADMKNEDPYLAVLAHRSCPDPNGDPSPAEKLMNRQLRTRLPAVMPPKENQTAIQIKNMQKKRNQAFYHDRNAKELPKLYEGSTVRVYQHNNPAIKAKWSTKAKVVEQHHTPRSYIIRTEEGDSKTKPT